MKTRALETRQIVRASVLRAALVEQDDASVTFRTQAVVAGKKQLSSADSEMVNQQSKAAVGDKVNGVLRLSFAGDHVLRVQYAEGDQLPEGETRMLVGQMPGPSKLEVVDGDRPVEIAGQKPGWLQGETNDDEADKGRSVHLRTAALDVGVSLYPFRVEVRDLEGKRIAGFSGPEKDNFSNWDTINTGICRTLEDGSPLAAENFDLAHDECIYGLGEKFIKLDKTGQTIDLNMVDALGVTTPRSYKNIPFYVSTHGYGVFFNHSSLMTCWVGSSSAVDVQVAAEDDFLDYFVITGSIREVFDRYTDLTGKGVVPPKWTFGYWQSKISYKSAEETLEIARKMRDHEIPCDVIHLDTHWFKEDWYCDLEFDRERFPDPADYLKQLAGMGIKVSLWQLPYIPEGSKLFDDLKAVDGFVRNADGQVYDVGICFTPGFQGVVGVVDYTNPEAVRVHQDHFRRLFRMGVKVIKTDFGEAAPLDGVYHDGTPGHRVHNLYPLLYNRAIFEVTKEETGDGVVWARSAWAGNQRYPLHWGGDNSPNYANMLPQIEGGLSFGMSGFQFWSQDIGGFCGTTSDHLLVRWMQLGMFTSHSRIHGFGDREIYNYAPETMRICREYIRLRYRLLPYIFGQAMKCRRQSVPMMRPLVVDYQHDPTVWTMSDEFLFGDDLLVAPIFDDGSSRRVYLPEGIWSDWWSGERFVGHQWYEIEADLESIPIFVREGGLIPMGPVMNYVDELPTDRIDLVVALFEEPGESRFDVPVNDEVIRVDYRFDEETHVLRIPRSRVTFEIQTLGEGDVEVVSE